MDGSRNFDGWLIVVVTGFVHEVVRRKEMPITRYAESKQNQIVMRTVGKEIDTVLVWMGLLMFGKVPRKSGMATNGLSLAPGGWRKKLVCRMIDADDLLDTPSPILTDCHSRRIG